MLQAVLRQHLPQFLNVQKLPPEVVGVIFTYLTALDQVCFSLGCKYLFACFHSFLQAHDLQLAQLLPPEKRQKLYQSSLESNYSTHWRIAVGSTEVHAGVCTSFSMAKSMTDVALLPKATLL